ncbi:SpoIID/LytB domain-containing protein [Candidatus Sumerlaeota bacterium]|nr:SpoIID/LytB domain-containing protein [Candidatus Sumerlaeota bacterium]
MANEIKYENPFGPLIRIGMLEHQQEITFSLIGKYHLLDKKGKKRELLSEETGLLRATVVESQPAGLQWRVVLAKVRDRDSAYARAEMVERSLSLAKTEILELGHDVLTSTGRRFNARNYWICTSPFPTEQEARELRDKLPDATRYDILAERKYPPSGKIKLSAEKTGLSIIFDNSFDVVPVEPSSSRVVLNDVIVGVAYHWRHKERQKLRGTLRTIIDNQGKLTAVNILPLEVYLISVNSSEMMAACPDEFLKAQTITARNTVLATMGKHHYCEDFDLCADDHCQCYRGSSRETEHSRKGVLLTLGEVLIYHNEICDTRYSKMCGGLTADFERVWHGEPVEYLVSRFDGDQSSPDVSLYPADTELLARKFIESSPDVYCNTTKGRVPSYLKYSAQYFRWKVTYKRKELESLLKRFPEYNIGEFLDFEALSRSPSGRIEYLLVKGTEGEVIIGKEFEIRRALSPTFLYSSCFVWDIERDKNGKVSTITLYGAGWGHGVGMCQIGAAMMAYRGKKYEQILSHYYPQTELARLYDGKYTKKSLKQQLGELDFRVGDACYEFFNCYAVTQCPIWLKNIRLEAQKQDDSFVFVPVETPDIDLRKLKITCEFLEFHKDSAYPKKGVVS